MDVILNPTTGKYDFLGITPSELAALKLLFLKLDQTTAQHVINGAPQFDEGIEIKENKWVYLDGA